ncbi:MAG: hypothetical protein AAGD13_25525 [Pseudomonadota bacterium]
MDEIQDFRALPVAEKIRLAGVAKSKVKERGRIGLERITVMETLALCWLADHFIDDVPVWGHPSPPDMPLDQPDTKGTKL